MSLDLELRHKRLPHFSGSIDPAIPQVALTLLLLEGFADGLPFTTHSGQDLLLLEAFDLIIAEGALHPSDGIF